MSASRRPRWWQAAAGALAVGLTVTLSQSTTTAAFTAQTVDAGSSATAAPAFCSAPGRVDTLQLTGVVDTGIYQSQPGTNYAGTATIGVISSSGALARSLIKFPLTSKPSGCVVTSAVLSLRVSNGTTGSTIEVHRAAAAWNATTVNWNTAPGLTGTVATASSASNGMVITFDVATLVAELYAGPDYGFLIKDAAEGVGNNTQLFHSADTGTASTRPKLVVTWG